MVQFKETPVPSGSGLHERQLHISSGLRNSQLNAVISTDLDGVSFGLIGTAGGGDLGIFQPGLRAQGAPWSPVLPLPMTPTITILAVPPEPQAFPQTVVVQARLIGTDQFGCYQEEITPILTKVMTTTSQWFGFHCSKVFASIDDVFFHTGNIDPALSVAQIGWSTLIDPTKAGAAAIADHAFELVWEFFHAGTLSGTVLVTNYDLIGTAANWGIGTPHRVEPFGPSIPFPSPEIMGAVGTILRQRTTPTVLNTTARLPARGQLIGGSAPVTGVAIGRSAAGFQGTPHKFGFFSNDAWTTPISGINFGGSSSRGGAGVPTAEAQLGEDEIQISALLRTTMGTRRGANSTKAYRD